MSELERRFEAVMFPPGGRNGVISNGDLDTVAHWFAKTATVINSSQNYRVMVPEAVRHKTAVGAPTEFDVFLGRLRNPRRLIGYGQGVNAVGLVAPLDEEDRPDWLTDFRMHRLFGAQIPRTCSWLPSGRVRLTLTHLIAASPGGYRSSGEGRWPAIQGAAVSRCSAT
jgi:hypothetical protein